MTKCKGCGIEMQYDDPKGLGYSPKADSEYCQRCFRLRHYGDLMYSMKEGINPDEVLAKINKTKGLILFVVDIFDFEASMIDGLNKHLLGRDILMVITKRDILPVTISNEKIKQFIFSRLKEYQINVQGIIVTGKGIDNKDVIFEVLREYDEKSVVVMGKANVGKSTLINALLEDDGLSTSYYPGTTLDFNELEIDGYTFIDTPGIEVSKSMVMKVDEKNLKSIVSFKPIKPASYQLNKDQAFILGGLVSIKLFGCEKASAVFYVSNDLKVHRTKASVCDSQWATHYGKLYKPTVTEGEYTRTTVNKLFDKMDIVIDGLGWICVSNSVKKIEVTYPKDVNVRFRKAAI